jgi:hypothetical protein
VTRIVEFGSEARTSTQLLAGLSILLSMHSAQMEGCS